MKKKTNLQSLQVYVILDNVPEVAWDFKDVYQNQFKN